MEDYGVCYKEMVSTSLNRLASISGTFLTTTPSENRTLLLAEIQNFKLRILGLPCTLQNDTVCSNVSKLFDLKKQSTQRRILRIKSYHFDPIGKTAQ